MMHGQKNIEIRSLSINTTQSKSVQNVFSVDNLTIYFVYFIKSTRKLEPVGVSKTLAYFCQDTWCYVFISLKSRK